MPVPKGRRSSRRRDMQRTHKKLKATNVGATCKSCGATILGHRICPECGFYAKTGRNYRTTVTTA